MRGIAILLLLLVVSFGGTCMYECNNLDQLHAQSVTEMNKDVPNAITIFKPALEVADYETFGKATRTRRQWCADLQEALITKLNKPTFSPADSDNVLAGLQELKNTTILTTAERTAAQRKIFEAIVPTPATIAQSGFLPDFDQFVKFLESLGNKGILDPDMAQRLDEVLAKARQIDRYPIALRTADYQATLNLRNGLAYLGIAFPPAPCVIPVPRTTDTSSWNPGPAETCFNTACGVLEQFEHDWAGKFIPPATARMLPIAHLDSALTRFNYSVLTRRKDGSWGIYLLPGLAQAEASEEEIRSSYLVGMAGNIQAALTTATLIPPTDPIGNFTALAQALQAASGRLSPAGQISPVQLPLFFVR